MGFMDWIRNPKRSSEDLLERHREDVTKRRKLKIEKLEHKAKVAKLEGDIRKQRQVARPKFGFGSMQTRYGPKKSTRKKRRRTSSSPVDKPSFDSGMGEDERIKQAFG